MLSRAISEALPQPELSLRESWQTRITKLLRRVGVQHVLFAAFTLVAAIPVLSLSAWVEHRIWKVSASVTNLTQSEYNTRVEARFRRLRIRLACDGLVHRSILLGPSGRGLPAGISNHEFVRLGRAQYLEGVGQRHQSDADRIQHCLLACGRCGRALQHSARWPAEMVPRERLGAVLKARDRQKADAVNTTSACFHAVASWRATCADWAALPCALSAVLKP